VAHDLQMGTHARLRMSKLERQLQIELLWARRRVFADEMNAHRLTIYISRRAVASPNSVLNSPKNLPEFDMRLEFPSQFG
jgi:hypothetical protein